jgi:lipoprotein-releasing system permease protein
MPLELRIARRYFWSARRRMHTAMLAGISMLGLAIGVFALLVSIALLSGMQGQIKERLIASSPQLLIEPNGSMTIDDAERIAAAAKRLGASDIRPSVAGTGWGANEEEKRGRPMRIRSGSVTLGPRVGPGEIELTRDFAASIALDLGQSVVVVAPRTRLTPFGPMPVWRKYRIARLRGGGNDEHSGEAYLPLDEAEQLFGTNGKPTAIETWGDADRAEPMQAALQKEFPSVQVKTWKDINRPLFLALRLEKVVMFATISLVIFVAALNLISSISMIVLEKRPSVGILRTLGASERSILIIFLEVGLLIGLTGTILGNVFGIGAVWAASRYHLFRLPSEVSFISYVPFKLDPEDLLWVNVVAVILSMLAAWYPARIASRLDPIVAIKEEG